MEKKEWAMTLDTLKELLTSNQFDHATWRNIGRMTEGLYIYAKGSDWGFVLAGMFPKDDPEGSEAYALVRHTGVSVGSRGNG